MEYNEKRRKELIRKITESLKHQDIETLQDIYNQTRSR